jgi:hypothetical protein
MIAPAAIAAAVEDALSPLGVRVDEVPADARAHRQPGGGGSARGGMTRLR